MLCDKSENAYVKINLAKKYKTLKARLGVNDQSEIGTDSITITLVGDDALLKTVTLHKGQHVDVSLNVTGVLELDFNFSGRLGKVEPAVGEPRVYR